MLVRSNAWLIESVIKSSLNPILFGGDQLIASHARSAKKAKLNSVKSVTQFDGLVPVAEDWHTKLNFLTVSSIMSLRKMFIALL